MSSGLTFKQSTAYTHQFLMVLSSDHTTGATGKNGSLVVKIGKNGAGGVTAGGTTTEVDSTNLPGMYSIAFTTTDTNTLGSFSLDATATACDHTTEVHRIDSQIFPDMSITAAGLANISSVVKQNTIFSLPFIMTVNSVATPALTGFVSQRNFGSGWSNTVNSVTELGFGWYNIVLAAADTNNNGPIAIHITATNADARDITLYTQP